MKKLLIHFDSRGASGNIYVILGMVSQAMKNIDQTDNFNILKQEVYAQKSYKDALAVIRQRIELIDIAGVD